MKKSNISHALIPLLLAVVIVLVGARVFYPMVQPPQGSGVSLVTALSKASLDGQRVTVLVADQPLEVEIVNQPASITQGLSGRSEIGAEGMLFVLGSDRQAVFWMKDMLFDLDLVWIRDGEIVAILQNVPRPARGTPDAELELYSPEVLVDMVLEIPAGQAAAQGFEPGQQLFIP